MPKKPTTHIQNTAPGPPSAMASATPPILPRPTVADSAADKRLEMVDRAGVVRVVVHAAQDVRAMRQGAILGETAPDSEQHAGANNPVEHIVMPENGVEIVQASH